MSFELSPRSGLELPGRFVPPQAQRAGEAVVQFPNGAIRRFGGVGAGRNAAMHVRSWKAVPRILLGGAIGFAEAYMAGEIETDDLGALLEFALANEKVLGRAPRGFAPMRGLHRLLHLIRPNTRRGSRRNIAAHYDLGNSFYRLWLDLTMSYSAALFESGNESLEDAQAAKYRRMAELAAIHAGSTVLELGCGWGGFAELAAREFGCRVTGITLSDQQLRFARDRISEAGFAERVELRLQDYRDCPGQYDAVVSIEMFEAVGERNWPRYFQVLRDRMAPGAKAALQIITIAEPRYPSYRASADFIQRYIFPGGMLPTRRLVEDHARSTGLAVLGSQGFGQDYVRTLEHWGERFRANWPAIQALGFDQRFRRMWEYYLCYCEVGFRCGRLDVVQFQLQRP
jgi:cyclopropane-fatty-acyl-phospholipid synthase